MEEAEGEIFLLSVLSAAPSGALGNPQDFLGILRKDGLDFAGTGHEKWLTCGRCSSITDYRRRTWRLQAKGGTAWNWYLLERIMK